MSEPDTFSRALMESRPELAGHVHYVNGRPWCDGINHTTMCRPGSEEQAMSEAASEARPVSSLTAADRRIIAKAHEVAALTSADSMREHYGQTDGDMARAAALGQAQFLLAEMAAIIARLTADAGPDATAGDGETGSKT